MFLKFYLLLVIIAQDCLSQDEEGPYRGKLIGKLNSYHHQVSGDVYAIDEWTILLVNFNYDGTGDDSFFWAGDSGRPGPQGFIVPDQLGKTNILERYYNEDVRLTLPEGKRISRIKWFAIYDIGSQNTFGDVYIPDDFEAPREVAIGPLIGHGVSSQSVRILDSNTFLIPEFRYDGSAGEAYFWAGQGPQPHARGTLVPDEYGYLEPLRVYRGEDVRLAVPGGGSILGLQWLSVWDRAAGRAVASVLLGAASVPPAPSAPLSYKSPLPNCKQLHRDFQVSWEVFGSQISIELVAKLEPAEYMAFGISGRSDASRMVGADVAVAHYDAAALRGVAADYNVTQQAPCVHVLGQWQGVCADVAVGGRDSNQLLAATVKDGLTSVTYRRVLQADDPIDQDWVTERPQHVVWAVGPLAADGAPAFHRLFPKRDLALPLKETGFDDCFSFTHGRPSAPAVWETAQLSDPGLRVFTFRVGPAGGARGVRGRAGASGASGAGAGGAGASGAGASGAGGALAWYVNGQLAPDLHLRRGLQYTFQVWGGNDPHSATTYHPLVVTRQPRPRAGDGPALAGLHYPRRGPPSPTAAGGLCIGRHSPSADRRRDDDFATFRAFNKSLQWSCSGAAASLAVAPNSSWPDLVYYNSFTHPGMGGRILVVDRHRRTARKPALSGSAAITADITIITITTITAITVATITHAALVAAYLSAP